MIVTTLASSTANLRAAAAEAAALRTDTNERVRFSANFLWMCQGYYRQNEGYTPEREGMDDFKGRIAFLIDNKPLDFHQTVTYRLMMFTGAANVAWVFGYFRASWTLRSERIADFVCRLLNHMHETCARSVAPAFGLEDEVFVYHCGAHSNIAAE